MAVSNAVGSNVFDILLCMGLPWFLKTTLVTPGKPIQVFSAGRLVKHSYTWYILVYFLRPSCKTIRCSRAVALFATDCRTISIYHHHASLRSRACKLI